MDNLNVFIVTFNVWKSGDCTNTKICLLMLLNSSMFTLNSLSTKFNWFCKLLEMEEKWIRYHISRMIKVLRIFLLDSLVY